MKTRYLITSHVAGCFEDCRAQGGLCAEIGGQPLVVTPERATSVQLPTTAAEHGDNNASSVSRKPLHPAKGRPGRAGQPVPGFDVIAFAEECKANGGGSIYFSGRRPPSDRDLFYFSIFGHERLCNEAELRAELEGYLTQSEHLRFLLGGVAFLGAGREETGEFAVDLSQWVPGLTRALELGALHKQRTLYHPNSGGSIAVLSREELVPVIANTGQRERRSVADAVAAFGDALEDARWCVYASAVRLVEAIERAPLVELSTGQLAALHLLRAEAESINKSYGALVGVAISYAEGRWHQKASLVLA